MARCLASTGCSGAVLESPEPYRTDDVRQEPRFHGWWPSAHPSMRSFLGVPIVWQGRGRGALPRQQGGREGSRRSAAGRDLRPPRRGRDRERAAARALPRAHRGRGAQPARPRAPRRRDAEAVRPPAPAEAGHERSSTTTPSRRPSSWASVRELAREAMDELRTLIVQLRPARARARGPRDSLGKHVEVVGRTHGDAIVMAISGDARADTRERATGLRIAQEAVTNALRHAAREQRSPSSWSPRGRLELTGGDDGAGFDPAAPATARAGSGSRRCPSAPPPSGARWGRIGARGRGPPSGSRSRGDPGPGRRRPPGRARGAAHVPRAAGRPGGGGRSGGRRRRGAGARGSGPTSC